MIKKTTEQINTQIASDLKISKSETRFKMIKKRHKESFEEACAKGKVDKAFIPFCEFVIKTKNYFTSSSCSGRIILLGLEKNEAKKESAFKFKSHEKITFNEIKQAFDENQDEILWLKTEPFILHIGTKDLEHAKKILKLMTKSGIKRGGIIVAKPGKFIVEFQGTMGFSVPVKENGTALIDETYFKYLIKIANEKLDKNHKMLQRMEKEAKKILD